MSLPWFRLYAELATDPKIQILAFEDQRHYVMLLCLKCNGTLDSESPSTDLRERRIARSLGLALPEALAARKRLVDTGLIDKRWQPLAWAKRQFESDSSAVRTARWREKRRGDGVVTSQRRHRSEQIRTEHKEAPKGEVKEAERSQEARNEAMERLRKVMPDLRVPTAEIPF